MSSSARRLGLLALLATASTGCTQEEATPWGKLLFAFMIVALVAIPIVFVVTWRRRRE